MVHQQMIHYQSGIGQEILEGRAYPGNPIVLKFFCVPPVFYLTLAVSHSMGYLIDPIPTPISNPSDYANVRQLARLLF